MKTSVYSILIVLLLAFMAFSQTNQWMTQYVTFDDATNGTGYQTSSVGVIGPNRFVALVTQTPFSIQPQDLFNPPGNYLVGYWDADSAVGRVPSPINGQQQHPLYGFDGQFTDWTYVLDQVRLKGAWQLVGAPNGYVYVANNDDSHNILVFELTSSGVVSTQYRMETGTEYIWGIDVDDNGYVYVLDYEGTDAKTNEVKVYAGIGAPGTTWGDFGGHNDPPTTTIDLPPGIYQGIAVSGDGTQIFISASSQRSLMKFVGDPVNGYTQDTNWSFTLSPDDTVGNGGSGTPTLLGLGYMEDPPFVYAVCDTFLGIGLGGGYTYGRIYVIDGPTGAPMDTIDIAEWNFAITGAYNTGSNNGRAGGFTSVLDVDVDNTENALYSQTFYGWAVEKWIFDGDLHVLDIQPVARTIPNQFQLHQNYPNPFNPVTTIEFDLPAAGPVTLEVFNLSGQKVATLVNQRLSAGNYRITFDGQQLPSGIYFYRLRTGEYLATRKMTLVK